MVVKAAAVAERTCADVHQHSTVMDCPAVTVVTATTCLCICRRPCLCTAHVCGVAQLCYGTQPSQPLHDISNQHTAVLGLFALISIYQ